MFYYGMYLNRYTFSLSQFLLNCIFAIFQFLQVSDNALENIHYCYIPNYIVKVSQLTKLQSTTSKNMGLRGHS